MSNEIDNKDLLIDEEDLNEDDHNHGDIKRLTSRQR